MKAKQIITINETEIAIISKNNSRYISLTDMLKAFGDEAVIYNWMRSRATIEFLGLWEQMYNPDFKPTEFDRFKNETGSNTFVMSPKKWIEGVNAIGILSKSGRYGGGTYAHKDIAFEFGTWLSPQFKLYLIKEFQRLKEDETKTKKLEWNLQRTLAKVNYKIHTDSIKSTIVPNLISKQQISFVYASEGDLLNVALFGKTAKQWKEENPELKGNIRDYATLEQLIVLSNMESVNALLISQELGQQERLKQLNNLAITQMKSLVGNKQIEKLMG